MKVGLYVTVLYVALAYGSGYITGFSADWLAVGVGEHVQNLIAGGLDQTAKAIATVALTLGLAMPALRGDSVVPKSETAPPEG